MTVLSKLTGAMLLAGLATAAHHADASIIANSQPGAAVSYFDNNGNLISSGVTQAIGVNPAWAPNGTTGTGAQWVSYADTGTPGTVSVPNDNYGLITYSFRNAHDATLTGVAQADDQVHVFLDGSELIGTGGDGGYALGHAATFSAFLAASTLDPSAVAHTLEIYFYQRAQGPTGVQYTFSVTPIPAALPLAATAMAGLGGLGWLKRRRTQTDTTAAA